MRAVSQFILGIIEGEERGWGLGRVGHQGGFCRQVSCLSRSRVLFTHLFFKYQFYLRIQCLCSLKTFFFFRETVFSATHYFCLAG